MLLQTIKVILRKKILIIMFSTTPNHRKFLKLQFSLCFFFAILSYALLFIRRLSEEANFFLQKTMKFSAPFSQFTLKYIIALYGYRKH